MTVRQTMTLDEFLTWERCQETKHEFDGVGPVATPDVCAAHGQIQSNLIGALGVRLRGRDCRVYGSGMKIDAAGHIRYPDSLVIRTRHPRGTEVFPDPVVLFEIVSRTTSRLDRFVKFEYLFVY